LYLYILIPSIKNKTILRQKQHIIVSLN